MKETKNESEFWFYFATMSDLTRSVVSMGLYNIEEKFKHFQNIIQGLTGLIIQESQFPVISRLVIRRVKNQLEKFSRIQGPPAPDRLVFFEGTYVIRVVPTKESHFWTMKNMKIGINTSSDIVFQTLCFALINAKLNRSVKLRVSINLFLLKQCRNGSLMFKLM